MTSSQAVPGRAIPYSPFQRAFSIVAVAVITAGSAWLRLHELGAKGFWLDEGITAGYMRMGWYGTTRLLWRREGNMSLYFILLGGWLHFGDSEAWYRGLSVVFAVATVPFVYAIARRCFGVTAGIVAALLMSVNAYHVRYAQEARSYALTIFLVTCATWFLVRAVEKGRRRDWTLYIACGALAMYAHFYAVLVIAAHWIALRTLRNGPGGQFYRAVKLMGLWTLPIWIFLVTTGVGVLSWLRRPGLLEIYNFLVQFSGNDGVPLGVLYAACMLAAVGAAFRAWRDPGRPWLMWCHTLVLCWFFVPVLIVLAVTLIKPVFLARYLAIVLPGLVLSVAAGIASLKRIWLVVPLTAAIAWFGIAGVRSYYKEDFDIVRADYRGATAYLLEHSLPGDAILFHQANARYAYDYYAGRFFGTGIRPIIAAPGHGDRPVWRDFMARVTPQVLQSVTRDYSRVWVVLSNNSGPDGEDQLTRLIRSELGRRFRVVEERAFEGMLLCLFALPTDAQGPS